MPLVKGPLPVIGFTYLNVASSICLGIYGWNDNRHFNASGSKGAICWRIDRVSLF